MRTWARELGFDRIGVTHADADVSEQHLQQWLSRGWYGEMEYMSRHGTKRSRPAELVAGTIRVVSARINYLPHALSRAQDVLDDPERAYLSRYALGRDYHKVLRGKLRTLASRMQEEAGPFGYRVFTDSAPVLEKALAARAGIGWIGKHTNLLAEDAGSWFFLGEIYTDLPLPVDEGAAEHCGDCTACIEACPTGAIVAPYRLDARLCISYLTIELTGSIPEPLRPLIGNRVYGCDDCQLVCPWNRYAKLAAEPDFEARDGLSSPALTDLFAWSEEEFLRRTEGSAMRRIGYVQWLRNVAVGLGNAPAGEAAAQALAGRADHPSALVREHVSWALARQERGLRDLRQGEGV